MTKTPQGRVPGPLFWAGTAWQGLFGPLPKLSSSALNRETGLLHSLKNPYHHALSIHYLSSEAENGL